MWINPEDGMTWEQICDRTWGNLSPDMQAQVAAYCTETGISRNDLFKELTERFQVNSKDPLTGPQYRAEFQHWLNGQWYPCGHDPHLTRTP